MMRFVSFAGSVALLTLASAPAAATLLRYTVSGTDVNANGETEYALFYLDAQPAVLPQNAGAGANFRLKFISGTFQYGSTTKTLQDVVFFNSREDGGFGVVDPDVPGSDPDILSKFLLGFLGPQLYDGPESAPTLRTGNYTVFDQFDGSPISLNIAAVPEAASWMMMIAGFGAIGTALRQRRVAFAYG